MNKEIDPAKRRERILTGDRPTGPLHLGHWVGSVERRVELQGQYDTLIIIADLQVFTDHLDRYPEITENVHGLVLDYLALGLSVDNTYFIQSQVPQISELFQYLTYLVTLERVRRNPTVKEEVRMYGTKNLSFGFAGYPISQAADILFCKADLVPVGKDQLPHLEQTREIAGAFNRVFGREVFPLPKASLGRCPILVGTDGKKMSKSLGNFIAISDSPEVVTKKVMDMVTDPGRQYRKDKGNPEICPVFQYHCLFGNTSTTNEIKSACTCAGIGCVECKRALARSLNKFLEPVREKRTYFELQPELIKEILKYGIERARKIGDLTLEEVREVMGLSYKFLKENGRIKS